MKDFYSTNRELSTQRHDADMDIIRNGADEASQPYFAKGKTWNFKSLLQK